MVLKSHPQLQQVESLDLSDLSKDSSNASLAVVGHYLVGE